MKSRDASPARLLRRLKMFSRETGFLCLFRLVGRGGAKRDDKRFAYVGAQTLLCYVIVCTYIYIYIYMYVLLSLSLYTYIYIYTYVAMDWSLSAP